MPRVTWQVLDRGRWLTVDRTGLVEQVRRWREHGATYPQCAERIRPAMTSKAARQILHPLHTKPARTWRILSGRAWVVVSKEERNQAIARWVQEDDSSLDECARRIRPALTREGVRKILAAEGVAPRQVGPRSAPVVMIASGIRVIDAVRRWAAERSNTTQAVATASGLPPRIVAKLLSGRPGPWARFIDRLIPRRTWTVAARVPEGGEPVRHLHTWVCQQVGWDNIAAAAAAAGCTRATLYDLRDGEGARRWMEQVDALVAGLGAILVIDRTSASPARPR